MSNFTVSGWSEVLGISSLTLVTMIIEMALWLYTVPELGEGCHLVRE